MLLIFTFFDLLNICISGSETNQTDCNKWLPDDKLPDKIFIKSTDFSSLGPFNPNEIINLGIGNIPDLLIDLSTLVTVFNYSDNINLIINVTNPDENDIVLFDFEVTQFDDLNSLTFNNLRLKPNNKLEIHTTSTANPEHSYKLNLNNVIFQSGYAFDSDIFQPISQFDFEDITIVEIRDRWVNSKDPYSVCNNFFFDTNLTRLSNTNLSRSYSLENGRYHGKVTFITEYVNEINFVLNNAEDNPLLGFEIFSEANVFNFSGGWHENITLNNDGLQMFYNGNEPIYINTKDKKDTTLPIAVSFGIAPKFQSENLSIYKIKQDPNVRFIIIDSDAETVTLTSPWNISTKTSFTRNSKSKTIILKQLNFSNETSSVYREDVKNKMFQVNDLIIMDKLKFTYPGETDINIVGDLTIRPGVNLTVDSKIRFDKNRAIFKIVWDSISGFPFINIKDPSIVDSKGIPRVIFTDEEPVSKIADANVTYDDIIYTPIKIMCGTNISKIDFSKFSFQSPNPSFSENGVWDYFFANESTGNSSSFYECLYVNMTDFPEVPIIPVPTATKDPAAVNRKAMISMIVIFCFLFVSGILGYFTKFLKQNKRDREKEKQDELDKLKNERDLSDSSSKFDDSEVTQGMSESDLSDHALSFEQDLSIGSDDDFSTTTGNMTANQSVSMSRKNTLPNESISANGAEQGVKSRKRKRLRTGTAKTPSSKANSKDKDDVNTPLLQPNDDS